MIVTTLNADEIESAICALPSGFAQAHRMVRYLANNPNACTVDVNSNCAIGNLSDVARKANHYLYSVGYFIACQRPPTPYANRFGEPSNMFHWGIFTVKAANDAEF